MFSLHYIVYKNYICIVILGMVCCTVYTELLWYGLLVLECHETYDLWFLFHVSVSLKSHIFLSNLAHLFVIYRSHTGVKNTGILSPMSLTPVVNKAPTILIQQIF
jgi:hypothetical protein